MGDGARKIFSSKIEERQPIRLVREVQLNPGMDAQKSRTKILVFIGVSLLLHSLTMISLYFTRVSAPVQPPEAVFVDLNALPPPAMVAQPKEAPKQVVESEKAPDAATPEDARYFGERNQVAKEETKARKVDIFRKGGAPTQAGNKGKALSLKDLAPSPSIAPPTKLEMEGYKQEQQKTAKAEQAGRPGNQPLDNAGSASNDFLKDVKDGDRTMLSTKEFVYFGYYRRIRQRLEVAWNSKLRSTLEGYVYGGRQLASDRNYVTGVVVILDRYGTITGVQVLERSGATDLDRAAVDAFNAAGPFPDPPSGLVDENGEIRIPWNFILQS
jgi:protein TonB